ncbi:MAG TPA: DUF4389 domain-containing protein [Gammaproteobacteria bacterium]
MNESVPPPDHAREDFDETEGERQRIEENVRSSSTWLRLLFMILFFALWSISRIVVFAVVVLQFLWVLFSGEPNERLSLFGHSLATYSYQIVRYLTFDTEEQPFPFSDWPVGPPEQ